MKILILLTIISILNANEINFTGKFNTFISSYNEQYTSTLQLNLDYDYENIHFQATPFMYSYDTKSGNTVKHLNWRDSFDKTDAWFRSLYMTYTYNKWSIGVGVTPFSNSSPTKFNDDYIEDGEGILLLNSSELTSIFIIHKIYNSRTIFGIGTSEHIIVDSGNYIDKSLRDDSYTIFLINTYTHDKFEFVTEYLYNDVRYYKLKLSDSHLLGMTIAWNDSEKSGLSIYGSIGGSYWHSKANESKNEIFNHYFSSNNKGLSGVDYGNKLESLYTNNFDFNDKITTGAAHMIGIRKDLDFFNNEFFINSEWTHTYNNWISGNQGTFYLGKNNQYYSIRNDSFYGQIGWIVNGNLRFRIQYEYVELNTMGKIGNPSITIPTDESIKPNVEDNTENVTLLMGYKF